MNFMATPQHTPALWVIYKFGSASISQLPYTQFVCSMPPSREDDSKRKDAFSIYTCNLYGHALAQEPLPHGS